MEAVSAHIQFYTLIIEYSLLIHPPSKNPQKKKKPNNDNNKSVTESELEKQLAL